jgi:hypothetical protein
MSSDMSANMFPCAAWHKSAPLVGLAFPCVIATFDKLVPRTSLH